MRRILKSLLLVVLLAVTVADLAAQDWAKAMFDHTSHDFGMVARGANAEHRFPLENIYLEDAHIKSLSSSCTCTAVRVTKPLLKTYENAEIIATLNTRQFTGRKDATIRVVFDKPFPAEVQLHCYSYIRTDVGGAYRVTRNLDVTAGVRYSQDRERLKPLTDGKQDSQAVYVGTQFRF